MLDRSKDEEKLPLLQSLSMSDNDYVVSSTGEEGNTLLAIYPSEFLPGDILFFLTPFYGESHIRSTINYYTSLASDIHKDYRLTHVAICVASGTASAAPKIAHVTADGFIRTSLRYTQPVVIYRNPNANINQRIIQAMATLSAEFPKTERRCCRRITQFFVSSDQTSYQALNRVAFANLADNTRFVVNVLKEALEGCEAFLSLGSAIDYNNINTLEDFEAALFSNKTYIQYLYLGLEKCAGDAYGLSKALIANQIKAHANNIAAMSKYKASLYQLDDEVYLDSIAKAINLCAWMGVAFKKEKGWMGADSPSLVAMRQSILPCVDIYKSVAERYGKKPLYVAAGDNPSEYQLSLTQRSISAVSAFISPPVTFFGGLVRGWTRYYARTDFNMPDESMEKINKML